MNLFSWYWLFSIVITVLYTALMLYFIVGWNKIRSFSTQKKIFTTKVAVIVPFFNEEQTIKKCLVGLLEQNIQTTDYSIIAINDGSTDSSVQIVKELAEEYNRLNFVESEGEGKKAALSQAVKMANADLIVTTDADCTYKKDWLSTLVDYYEQYNPRMIIGPVFLKTGNGIFNAFQQLEFNSLIMTGAGAAGIGHPIMCNGANLAFKKEAFMALEDPLKEDFKSGDDVFLMHNLKKESAEDIHFLKSYSGAVTTQAASGLKKFMKQRQRWASKANGYKDGDTVFTASIVFLISILPVLGALLMIIEWHYIQPILFTLIFKTGIDILFYQQSSTFFKHNSLLPLVPLFELVYAVYVSVIGTIGILSSRK